MKEHLLHFIWQNKLFNTKELKTVDGSDLQVIDFGRHNKDGGPDFVNAKVNIDGITLAGNIELHINASHWKLHKHEVDKKYDSVILHVVYFNDEPTRLPTLELNGRISPILLEKYESMMLSRESLICKNLLHTVDELTLSNWKERLVIERLERKSKEILLDLSVSGNDWETICYRLSAKYFGSHINKEPFELITYLLDYKIILRHLHSSFQLEALLFGVSGFLNVDLFEEYPLRLKKEYEFLKHKYALQELQIHQWQFLRIRPVSFPTIRIAWFAQFLTQMPLFKKMLYTEKPEEMLDLELPDYWNSHYIFEKKSKPVSKQPGNEFKTVLVINAFAPLFFAYGKFTGEQKYLYKALEMLTRTNVESNVKTKIFAGEQWQLVNAFHSQAVLELYDHYCTGKRCLQCAIGHKILRT